MAKKRKQQHLFWESLKQESKEQNGEQNNVRPIITTEQSFQRFIEYAFVTCDAFSLFGYTPFSPSNDKGRKPLPDYQIVYWNKFSKLSQYRIDKYETIQLTSDDLRDYVFYSCLSNRDELKQIFMEREKGLGWEIMLQPGHISFFRKGEVWFNGTYKMKDAYKWFYKATEKDCTFFNKVKNGLGFCWGSDGSVPTQDELKLTVESTQELHWW